jgi:hypothetical protein
MNPDELLLQAMLFMKTAKDDQKFVEKYGAFLELFLAMSNMLHALVTIHRKKNLVIYEPGQMQ